MHAHRVFIAVSVLLGSTGIAVAQTDQPAAGGPMVHDPKSTNAYPRVDPFNPNPTNSYANPNPIHRDIHNPYFGEDNPYVTSTATPRRKKSAVNPAEAAAQQQSGFANEDVRSLLQQQGYASVNDVHADPNSIWVWQADALKNGRRVRLGIDNRGNLLELGASTQPCTSLGAGFGAGPLGTGARISEADRCSGR
jgi:hypothetical protein